MKSLKPIKLRNLFPIKFRTYIIYFKNIYEEKAVDNHRVIEVISYQITEKPTLSYSHDLFEAALVFFIGK